MFEDNNLKHRFEWTEGGLVAFATYQEHPGFLAIPHVVAPVPLRGTGAAGRLMQAIVAHARAGAIKIKPTCPYAAVWFARHPEASDVLA